jgi:uncharacterized OsmC-like protein
MFDLQNMMLAKERVARAVKLRPSLAQTTEIAKARMDNDLRFDIDVDGCKVRAEVPVQYGGNGTAPGAGAYALSSLISCLAVGYLMRFAERDLPVSGLEIEVQADHDSALQSEYTDVRYIVTVESDAPEAEIISALDENDANSFGLAMFQRPVNTHREVHVRSTTG